MTKLIKTFETENNFNNVIVPLSLDIDELVFVFHHTLPDSRIRSCINIIRQYKTIPVSFINADQFKQDDTDKNCYIDISAQEYSSLVLSEIAFKNDLTIIYYDKEERKIKRYRDHSTIVEKPFSLTISDIIRINGGHIEKNMHPFMKEKESIALLEKGMEFFKGCYPQFVTSLSRINEVLKSGKNNGLNYYLDEERKRKILSDQNYKALQQLGFFDIKENKLIFPNEEIAGLFEVSGTFLENYIYRKLKESGLFDEVIMSAKIEFNDRQWTYPAICEIDCLLLKDNHLLFTSLKSNKVDNNDLFEIRTHNDMFGNDQSSAVIATVCDLDRVRPSTYAKAEELGVFVIDGSDFKNNEIATKFRSIIDKKYRYDTL